MIDFLSRPFSCIIPFLEKTSKITKIVITEARAVLFHVLPARIEWVWLGFREKIQSYPLKQGDEISVLHLYGKIEKLQKNKNAILLLHGDHGHPATLLHLAKKVTDIGLPIFSIALTGIHKNENFKSHQLILDKAIKKIKKLTTSEEIFCVGHSKGAILSAYRQFVILDPSIKATISIAGRLKDDDSCHYAKLKKIVGAIHKGIESHNEKFLVQIVPKDDWNTSQSAMKPRAETSHIVPGMHLSGLYEKETQQIVYENLQNFIFPN